MESGSSRLVLHSDFHSVRKMGTNFSRACCDRIRDNDFKWKEGLFSYKSYIYKDVLHNEVKHRHMSPDGW